MPNSVTRVTRVTDFDLASLLVAEGCHFVRLERTPDPRRLAFVIEGQGEKLDRLCRSFDRGVATVNVAAFVAARRHLRTCLARGVEAVAS